MELKDVQDFLTTNKDNDGVKSFVAGLNPITLDRVKEFVGKDKDAIAWLDSEKDKHATKNFETWKQNNLQGLVDAEYKKQHPDADPKDTEIAKLKKQFEDMQAEGHRKDLTNTALKELQEKKLPIDMVDSLVDKDEETTNNNIKKFVDMMAAHDEAIKTEWAKGNSYTPPSLGNPLDDKGSGSYAKKIVDSMNKADVDLQKARESYFK